VSLRCPAGVPALKCFKIKNLSFVSQVSHGVLGKKKKRILLGGRIIKGREGGGTGGREVY